MDSNEIKTIIEEYKKSQQLYFTVQEKFNVLISNAFSLPGDNYAIRVNNLEIDDKNVVVYFEWCNNESEKFVIPLSVLDNPAEEAEEWIFNYFYKLREEQYKEQHQKEYELYLKLKEKFEK